MKEVLDKCFGQFRRDIDPTKVFLPTLLAKRTITEGKWTKVLSGGYCIQLQVGYRL